MRKIYIIFFILIFGLSGCYKNNKLKVQKPNNLIPKKKLTLVIKNMEIAEAIISYERSHAVKGNISEKDFYNKIFSEYHVTPSQIRKSIDYYTSQGEVMGKIYNNILNDFSLMENEIYLKKNLRGNKFLNNKGQLTLNFRTQWFYGADSTLPYCFKPLF